MNMKKVLIAIFIFLTAQTVFASEVSVVGGLTREFTLQPEGELQGRIILRNNKEKPVDVKVYQTDYLFWADGRVEYGEPGSAPRSNAPWIHITPQQVRLTPRGTDSVFYTIKALDNDEMAGTYWSVLMIEPIQEEFLEISDAAEEDGRVGIRTITRQAIQIVTHIGDTGKRDLKFSDRQLLSSKDEHILQIDLENTGERWLRTAVWADIFDEEGLLLGRVEGLRRRIYPGCSARFNLELSQLPPGKYSCLVIADTGDENVFGARYQISIPDGNL